MSPKAVRKPMSHVDHMWLRMDDPTNLMMITGVLFFDGSLVRSRVVRVLEERLLTIERFGHRVVPSERSSRFEWEPDPGLDLDWHVQEAILPEPGDDAVLREFVSEWISKPLDASRPLWQVHLIRNYEGGGAMLWRLHHCIGDGVALMLALLSLTDLQEPRDEEAAASGERGRNPLRALFGPEPPTADEAKEHLRRVLPEAVKLLTLPAEKLASLSRWHKGGASVPAFGRLTLRPPDPRTRFKGRLGIAKRVAWSAPIPLAEITEVRLALGGTVNDVLTNAVAGGLRHYLDSHDELKARLNFRAVVPVSLRPPEEMYALGNQFGLVFLSLPIGIEDPVERLAELRRRMNRIKRSFEPVVALKIMAALGASPRAIQNVIVRIFGSKGTAVLTNVPGPCEPLSFAGVPIRSLMFWVPQSGRLGMGISILSYAEQIRIGLATDEGLVPDPETIVTAMQEEFRAMYRRAARR